MLFFQRDILISYNYLSLDEGEEESSHFLSPLLVDLWSDRTSVNDSFDTCYFDATRTLSVPLTLVLYISQGSLVQNL
ncbi:MAG: hypothetical protein CM1200mP35_10050 [Chloroflexota bacterium]|nr:MAG: hypothetical protein CM1200mP35_10050 [Chloroflexota bacterium]